jgi:hypothetical protein
MEDNTDRELGQKAQLTAINLNFDQETDFNARPTGRFKLSEHSKGV